MLGGVGVAVAIQTLSLDSCVYMDVLGAASRRSCVYMCLIDDRCMHDD